MDNDVFSAGVELGGLHSADEIRILICYILKSIKSELPKSIIIESIAKDGLANYFEIAAALEKLAENNNIVKNYHDGEEFYSITRQGEIIANNLDNDLPFSVKDKAVKAAIRLLYRKKIEKENEVKIEPYLNGYNVSCSVSDGAENLMTVTLFLPDSVQAETVREQFLKDPEIVYRGILALLTGDLETVGGILLFQKDKNNN